MLQSQLLGGDALLERIAGGSPERISTTQNRLDPAVGKVQQALLLWRDDLLPVHGADSEYGDETAAAVVTFKTEELGVIAPIPDVGPGTVQRLDEIAFAAEQPVVPPSPRVRRDIWRLQPTAAEPWHPIVDAYERAIGVMKAPNAVPPLDWQWQAAIHGIVGTSPDPRLDQCQHGTYFFLPWHRIYLATFEQALIAIIQDLPGVTDETKQTWALPYWDYHRPGTDSIPVPFRVPMRGNRTNHLFDGQRTGGMPLPRTALDTSRWLDVPRPFSAPPDGNPGSSVSFGGERTGFVHDAGVGTGMIEFAPHNAVHSRIGGKMGDPDTAGLDPIFWLHHANVDRLWEVWRRNIGAGLDESSPGYFAQQFPFLDLGGQTTTQWTAGDVVETAPLGYAYEDLSKPAPVFVNGVPVPPAPVPPPAPPVPAPPGPGGPGGPGDDAEPPFGEEGVPMPEHTPEPERAPEPVPLPAPRDVERIGALTETLQLRGGETRTIDLQLDEAPVRRFEEGFEGADDAEGGARGLEPPTRYFLRVADLTMQRDSSRVYELYLDPDGAGPVEPRFVAELPTFGLKRSEDPDAEHGLSFTFEVTELVEDLARAGAWNPAVAHLSLRLEGDATEREPDPEISIGSLDLFAG